MSHARNQTQVPQNLDSLEAQSSSNTQHEDNLPMKELLPTVEKPTFSSIAQKIAIFCAMLVFVFRVLSAQIFGVFTNEAQNVKRAQVAVVNFDGNAIGTELIASLVPFNRADGYPTFTIVDPQSTTPEEIVKEVFQGHYWSAVYANPGSTDRFFSAVNGSASDYDPLQTISFFTFEGRYFQNFAESMLQNLEIAVNTANAQISGMLVSNVLRNGNGPYALTRPSISALSVPIVTNQQSAGRQPFNMDNKPLINTVGTFFLTLMAIFPCIASHQIVAYAKYFHIVRFGNIFDFDLAFHLHGHWLLPFVPQDGHLHFVDHIHSQPACFLPFGP